MTLFKQIALLVSLVMLLLASIIVINDFRRAGEFMQGQLQTTAQDMATTLGIAISNMQAAEDKATLEVMFNAVFDSGYYSSIKLISVDGTVIHQKSQQITIEGVPGWFLKLVSLSPAQGTTQVMKGWNQLGQLKLSLHPGYAYSGLYKSLTSTLKWFSVLFVVAISVLWLLLHYLLLPLKLVKEQADAIHRNHFVQQKKLPATVELKRVVEAMNRMIAKVQGVFNDLENSLARYHRLLYHDKLTGLGNRRYMLDHLQQSLAEESSFHGCLGIIKLVNFELVRERHGYQLTDELVKKMADLISQTNAGQTVEKTARLSDDEFSFLLAVDESTVNDFINSLYQQFKEAPQLDEIHNELYLVAGVSALETGQSIGELLSDIDYCMNQAVSGGPYTIQQKVSSNLTLPHGKMQWRAWLEVVLHDQSLFLVGQPILDGNKVIVQRELFIRTRNEKNQVIPASAFMPMASSLGMALEIDKAVFKLVNEIKESNSQIPLALNLSATFFELADAQEEFDQLLIRSRDKGNQLCIEASHHVLIQHPVMCAQVSDRVKRYGHQFGIDNLDLAQSLQILQSAQFDYVKVNAKTLCDLSTIDQPVGYQALKTITDTLDLKIIAVGVDSQALFDQLQTLGIDAMQGNFLNEPVPL